MEMWFQSYNAHEQMQVGNNNGYKKVCTFDVTDTDVMPIVYQIRKWYTSGTFNFGQDSTFAGTISRLIQMLIHRNINSSGYRRMFDNLPEPTIGPDVTLSTDHFNTVLYTGNATDDTAVTGVGFIADWIWIKNRTSSFTHVLVDSSRGLSSRIYSIKH